jgi:hypothetical protein
VFLCQIFHVPKRIVWAMLKKEEERKEEKYPCQKA